MCALACARAYSDSIVLAFWSCKDSVEDIIFRIYMTGLLAIGTSDDSEFELFP